MAVVYFDASALVKLVVHEDEDDVAISLWNACDVAVSSRLAYPEVCAAIGAAHRHHRLDAGQVREAAQRWERYWAEVRPVELTEAVGREAGRLVRAHALSGTDGVHLACALAFAEADPVVACWDSRLAAGAAAEGLRTVP